MLASVNKRFIVEAKPKVSISVYDFGGSGPPLLIGHCLGFHGRCYLEMVRYLLENFHCYALDFRSSGDSVMEIQNVTDGIYHGSKSILEAQDEIPTLQGWIEDILAVVQNLNQKGVYLFGHSSGGLAMMGAALRLKNQVLGIYTYEPLLRMPSPYRDGEEVTLLQAMGSSSALWKLTMKRRDRFPDKDAVLQNYRNKAPYKDFKPKVLNDYIEYGFQNTPDGEGVELKLPKQIEALLYVLVEKGGFQTICRQLSKSEIPFNIGYGEFADPVQNISSFLPSAQFTEMKGFGHFAPFTHPAEIASAILSAFVPHAKL